MNKVLRVSVTGGILGGLFGSRASSLSQALARANDRGEEVVLVLPDTNNALEQLVSILFLVLTVCLWCPAPGFLVITRHQREY